MRRALPWEKSQRRRALPWARIQGGRSISTGWGWLSFGVRPALLWRASPDHLVATAYGLGLSTVTNGVALSSVRRGLKLLENHLHRLRCALEACVDGHVVDQAMGVAELITAAG
jgi:hypothetical protein